MANVFGGEQNPCWDGGGEGSRAAPQFNNGGFPIANLPPQATPLGLVGAKVPGAMNIMETSLSNNRNQIPRQNQESVPQRPNEKLKALNFHMSAIVIDDWQLEAVHNGDLTAKCYFAKRKLVWEILGLTERNDTHERVKSKFEIQWSDVLSLSPSFHPNQPSELNVELAHPPSFFLETNPQPKRHTQWKLTSDFTNGAASRCRRHRLVFAPGVLEKHYEKLVSDSHLLACSKVPFPSLATPYFDLNDDVHAPQYVHTDLINPHHDFRYYRVLPAPPPQEPFPMEDGYNRVQNQVMIEGENQFLVQDESQEMVGYTVLGTEVNPFQDGAYETVESLLGWRVNSMVSDADAIAIANAKTLVNPFGEEGLLGSQDNSPQENANRWTQENPLSREGAYETMEALLGRRVNTMVPDAVANANLNALVNLFGEEGCLGTEENSPQENAKRQRLDKEGNFQVSTGVMEPQEVEGDLQSEAIRRAFSNFDLDFSDIAYNNDDTLHPAAYINFEQ